MKVRFNEPVATENPTRVKFTPTGPSAKVGRVNLAPLDLRPRPWDPPDRTEHIDMLARYRKTIVAVIGAAVTWLVAAFADNTIDTQEWVALALAVATAAGVYATPNDAPEGEPARADVSEREAPKRKRGDRGDIGLLGLLVAIVLIAILAAFLR